MPEICSATARQPKDMEESSRSQPTVEEDEKEGFYLQLRSSGDVHGIGDVGGQLGNECNPDGVSDPAADVLHQLRVLQSTRFKNSWRGADGVMATNTVSRMTRLRGDARPWPSGGKSKRTTYGGANPLVCFLEFVYTALCKGNPAQCSPYGVGHCESAARFPHLGHRGHRLT
ncbi:hypothetical protein AOLI_G00298050 [Acnodon oligacanthus]